MSFGYIIYHTQHAGALDYLKKGVNPAVWKKRVKWRSAYQPDEARRDRELSGLAVNGLALSGHPDVLKALRQLLETGPSVEEESFRKSIKAQVLEAIAVN